MAYEEEYKMASEHGYATLEILRDAFKHEQECRAEEPCYDAHEDEGSFTFLMDRMELFIKCNVTSSGLNFIDAEFRYGPDIIIYPMYKEMKVLEMPIEFRISLCEDEEMLDSMIEFAYNIWRDCPKCGSNN